MAHHLAIIGGTGFDIPQRERLDVPVTTPCSDVTLTYTRLADTDVILLPRHGGGHAHPPHKVNHHANIDALARAGVTHVIGIVSVGALSDRVTAPGFGIPDDYVDFNTGATFHDDAAVHVDMSEPYCPRLRAALLAASKDCGEEPLDGGVYVTTRGPRLETRAEVRALTAMGGDYVGMTGGPEATLARERCMCYAQLAVVANQAAGRGGALNAGEIVQAMRDLAKRTQGMLGAVVGRVVAGAAQRDCGCATALDAARV